MAAAAQRCCTPLDHCRVCSSRRVPPAALAWHSGPTRPILGAVVRMHPTKSARSGRGVKPKTIGGGSDQVMKDLAVRRPGV